MNAVQRVNGQGNDGGRPRFLITIDTEGDNLWGRPARITTENSKFLPRFQALCESYGFKPTYLTNYEMAVCPDFQKFGRDVARRGAGEIGMHLHAWNSPPLTALTEDDYRFHPYLIEYPDEVMREKISFMTGLLEDTFEVGITSHRAGRWAFDERYARMLVDEGYRVDCSVTPHVSWREMKGDPRQEGGTDYRGFPEHPYFLDLEDIGKPGDSPLLEVPMTVIDVEKPILGAVRRRIPTRFMRQVANRLSPPVFWLRPNGRNLRTMLRVIQKAEEEGRLCVEFMLHSSEFMPGGSPTFRGDADIEALYDDMERLFERASGSYQGSTLTEFYKYYCAHRPHSTKV